MHDIEESRAIEAIRDFFGAATASKRAVTAEWLAGRLGLPLVLCEAALGRLVAAGLLRRVGRGRTSPLYAPRERQKYRLSGHLIVAVIVLAVTVGAAFIAVNSRYMFIAVEALVVALVVAFAWLDAELRDSHPPDSLR